ncbi:MAG: hypothetical protein U0231_09000 [Nitrospiraceae bacterium]
MINYGSRFALCAVVATALASPTGLVWAGKDGHVKETVAHAKEALAHEKKRSSISRNR